MAYSSLRDFIDQLEKTGRLIRVSEPVSPYLEMTEIGTRLIAEGGPAVIFENVKGHTMPVLIDLFGTVERVALGMGREPNQLREIGQTLAFLKQPEPPGGLREAVSMLPLLKTVMAMKPKTVSRAPCQEVVLTGDDIDLSKLPIQTCWPGEPAPLITWPLIVSKGPGDAKEDNYNLGIYKMQVLGKNKTLMRWLKHRGGAQQHARWAKEKREPFPAAAVIGCDPGTILAAVTPIPDTLSEYQFAGLLRGSKVELVDCKTIPLKVPAQAEIVLEGFVSLDEYGDEGPYGDHTGYYNSVEPFPVFTITAITMRKNPIYLTTYTGRPPDEPSVLGEALNEVFIPLLQQQFPEIVDFWLPPEGCSYRVAVVSIKKAYPGHAKRIMMGVWSFLRQFVYTKWIIVVDEDINCRDWKDVIWAMSTRMDPVRDLTLINQTPIDYLDFASPESGLGGKVGLDATNKWPPETHREWGNKIAMDQDVVNKISDLWNKWVCPAQENLSGKCYTTGKGFFNTRRLHCTDMQKPATMTKESTSQNDIVYAKQALLLMQKHNVSPAPENYAIWFNYAIGKNVELIREVDNVINNGVEFSQEVSSYIHNKFIVSGQSQNVIDESALTAQKILVEVLKVLNEFGDETQNYNQGVDEYLETISKQVENTAVASIVKELVSATTNLKKRGEKINQKLADSSNEINSLKKDLKQVTIESQRDFLTGVYNRKTFEKYVDEQMLLSRDKRSDLCLMMIDIDHFKQFNDRFGHLLGDEVLKIVAKTLTEILKGRDIVARFGGEEFIVVLPETPIEGAMKVAELTRLAIAGKELKRKDTGENYGTITVSMGVSRLRHDTDTLPLLIKRADDALYQSKRDGRNRATRES